MKFETSKWSEARLLEEFLNFDFARNDLRSSGVLRNFLEQYELTNQKALKLQESLQDDLATVLTGCRYQPVRTTRGWPRFSGVASVDELLKKIYDLTPKPMWDHSPEDDTVHMVPVIGTRPEQRLYLIVLSLWIEKKFRKFAVCRYCGRIFLGTKYCTTDCREAWHNRYTRAPRVIELRAQEKQRSRKKVRRKKSKPARLNLGTSAFEEFRSLIASKELNASQRDRLYWIKKRLIDVGTDLVAWDKLPNEQKKQFQRIEEMEQRKG